MTTELHIKLPTGNLKVMKFKSDLSVGEIFQKIFDHLKREGFSESVADYGIFQPAKVDNPARWLKPESSLTHQAVFSGSEVHFKKKIRPLKLRLSDEKTETLNIDESQWVQALIKQICTELKLSHPDEFSIQRSGAPDGDFLEPNLSLPENGITDDAEVQIRRKLFWEDRNITVDDTADLYLLYHQAIESVVHGIYPNISKDEAVELASIQCFVALGVYDAAKFQATFGSNPKKCLPEKWAKEKKVVSAVESAYKNLKSLQVEAAKFRYVQVCRGMKTYGMRIFKNVQYYEKKGKRVIYEKRAIGVNRTAFFQLDPEKYNIQNEFKYHEIRRYYTNVLPDKKMWLFIELKDNPEALKYETIDGEKIKNTISAYIDLTASKVREGKFALPPGQDSIPILAYVNKGQLADYYDAPTYDAFNAAMLGVPTMIPGMNSTNLNTMNFLQQQIAAGSGVAGSMQIMDLNSALDFLSMDLNINAFAGAGFEGLSIDEVRTQFSSHMKDIGSGAGQLMGALQKMDLPQIDSLAKSLALDAIGMLNTARFLDDSSMDPNNPLFSGARAISDAVSHLLACSKDLRDNPDSFKSKTAMQLSQHSLRAAHTMLAQSQQKSNLADNTSMALVQQSGEYLQAMCRQMAEAVSDIARNDPILMDLSSCLTCWGDELFLGANIMAPAILSQTCQAQLFDIGGQMSRATEALLQGASKSRVIDANGLSKLTTAGEMVTNSIKQLLMTTRISTGGEAAAAAGGAAEDEKELDDIANSLKLCTAEFGKSGNLSAQQITESCRIIQQNANSLKEQAKLAASVSDPPTQLKLVNATRSFIESTGQLFQVAKQLSVDPQNAKLKEQAALAAKNVQDLSAALTLEASKPSALVALKSTAKKAACGSLALAATARQITLLDKPSQAKLHAASDKAGLAVNQLVASLVAANDAPADKARQANVVLATKNATQQVADLVATSKTISSQVLDAPKRRKLNELVENAQKANTQLIDAVAGTEEGAAEAKEVREAIDRLSMLDSENHAQLLSANAGNLPLGTGSRVNALELLNLATPVLKTASQKMAEAVKSGQSVQISKASQALVGAVAQVMQAARTMAAAVQDRSSQTAVLATAQELIGSTNSLLAASREIITAPSPQEAAAAKSRFETSSGAYLQTIDSLSAAAVGLKMQDVDELLKSLKGLTSSMGLKSIPFPTTAVPSSKYASLVENLETCSASLLASSANVQNVMLESPQNLGSACKMMASAVPSLAKVIQETLAAVSDPAVRDGIVKASAALVQTSTEMIEIAKAGSSLPAGDAATVEKLSHAATKVSGAHKELLSAVRPGKAVLAQASKAMEAILASVADLKVSTLTPPKDVNIAESLPSLASASGSLQANLAQLLQAIRTNPDSAPQISKSVVEHLANLVKFAQAAAFQGKSQPGALPIAEQLVDETKAVATATDTLVKELSNLSEDSKNVNKVLAVSSAAQGVTFSIQDLVKSASDLTPGAAQTSAAMDTISETVKELDYLLLMLPVDPAAVAAAAATSATNKSVQECTADFTALIHLLANNSQKLVTACKEDPNQIGAASENTAHYTPLLVNSAKDLLTKVPTGQRANVQATSNASHSLLSLLNSVKALTLNPKDQTLSTNLNTSGKNVQDSLGNLLRFLQSVAQFPEIESAVKRLSSLAGQIDFSNLAGGSGDPTAYSGAQQKADVAAKTLATSIATAVQKAKTNPQQLGAAVSDVEKAMSALVESSKSTASILADATSRRGIGASVKITADATGELLGRVKSVAENPRDIEAGQELTNAVVRVTEAISGVSTSFRLGQSSLKGPEQDLETAAEKELADAAKIIEAAAKRLLQAKKPANAPRKEGQPFTWDDLSDTILEAAKSITSATGTLVQHATVVQKEITLAGRAGKTQNVYKADPAWAQGLISAAKEVAGGSDYLVDVANKATKKELGIEHLIAAVGLVSSSTARLVSASKVKSDPNSEAQRKLMVASNAIKSATASLVESVKASAANPPEEEVTVAPATLNLSMAAQIEENARIVKLEMELEAARKKQATNRSAQYTKARGKK